MQWAIPSFWQALAERLEGQQEERPWAWFDGFWDFFVGNREILEDGPPAVSGTHCGLPWLLLLLGEAAHVFVEVPCPPATLAVAHARGLPVKRGGGAAVRDQVKRLRRMDCEVEFGRWGLHVQGPAVGLSALQRRVEQAWTLAYTVAKYEAYVPLS